VFAGGYAYNATAIADHDVLTWPVDGSAKTIPTIFCTYGFSTVYAAFTIALIIDAICQTYMGFCCWRFVARIRHYVQAMSKGDGGS